MNPQTNAVLAIVLMITVGLSPVVSGSNHLPPDPPESPDSPDGPDGAPGVHDDPPERPEQLPQVPEEPPTHTDIEPVDRNLEDVFGRGETVNDVGGEGYTIIGTRLNEVDHRTQAAKQPLTLFRDGAGGRSAEDPKDLLDGGFGEPAFMGSHAWNHAQDAAFTGQEGYTTPRDENGNYPSFSRSMLVTPEIDLRTNFFMEDRAEDEASRAVVATYEEASNFAAAGCEFVEDNNAGIDNACQTAQSLNLDGVGRRDMDVPSTVYTAAYWACDIPGSAAVLAAAVAMFDLSQTYRPVSQNVCWPYRDFVEEADGFISLEFRNRHNLALDQDGVSVMVFTQPPTMQMAEACQRNPRTQDGVDAFVSISDTAGAAVGGRSTPPNCHILNPFSATTGTDSTYRVGRDGSALLPTMPDGVGYNGYRDWNTDAIDLTEWSGRSVWIGFYFGSGATGGPSHFRDPGVFNPNAGFNGFQLDDIVVKSPAAQVNVGVRPLERPDCRIDTCINGIPRLDPEDSLDVVASVTNFGTQEASIETVTHILRADDRSLINSTETILATLPPGAYLQRTMIVNDLDAGRYIVQTCVERNATGPDDLDADSCDAPWAEGECSADALEADPCNRVVEQRIDLFPVLAVRAGPVRLSSTNIGSGFSMAAEVTLSNDGNSDQLVTVQAFHIRLDRNLEESQDLLDDQQLQRTVLVPSQGSTDVSWDIAGADGDYRMVVQLHAVGNDPLPFRSEYDLLPALIQPWRPAAFTGDVVVDGNSNETDWFNFADRALDDGQGGTRFQVGNDADNLYITLRGLPSPRYTMFFNDLDDDDITSGGGGLAVHSNGNVHAFPYASDWQPTSSIAMVAAGGAHSVFLAEDGTVYSSGQGGLIGNGSEDFDALTPIQVHAGEQDTPSGFLEDIVAVQAGGFHSLALAEDGSVYAWGLNDNRQLGDDTTEDRSTPVRVKAGAQDSSSGFLEDIVAIQAGGFHSLALALDGSVYAWGLNDDGQLGDGTTVDKRTPVRVLEGDQDSSSNNLERVMAIEAGALHSLALTDDNKVYAWGVNSGGELGDGSTEPSRTTPVRVLAGMQDSPSGFLEDIVAVQAGGFHSLALTDDGEVYVWGDGSVVPLGDGGVVQQNEPVRVLAGEQDSGSRYLEDIQAVATGAAHTLALSDDGKVFAWGIGANGRLGDGSQQTQFQPVRVAAGSLGRTDFLEDVQAISASTSHSLALTDNDTVLGWGRGVNGRLGVGDLDENNNDLIDNVPTPEWIPVLDDGIPGVVGVNRPDLDDSTRFQAEIKIPINGNAGGLQAGPGDAIGFLLRHCTSLDQDGSCTSFPHGAPLTDGDGFLPTDGTLNDEIQQWHPILLSDPAAFSDEGFRYAQTLLSPAFSIGRGSSPSLFTQEFQQCPSFYGWSQQIPLTATTLEAQDKWNCSHYQEDGMPVLYWGSRPGSVCDGNDCLPYAGIPGVPTPTAPQVSTLATPPIEVPSGYKDPTILLAHQYSTQTAIEDRLVRPVSGPQMETQGHIRINHELEVRVEAWDPVQEAWMDQGPLRPQGGFPTEETTGLHDPRYPARHYYQDPSCGVDQTQPITDCQIDPTASSWWWPQGMQTTYRPPDRSIPVPDAATFHGGSPWSTDRIPLTGVNEGGTPFDFRGETVRLRLVSTIHPTADNTPTPDLEDWGWRIGGLAVIEGETFQHDLTIESAVPEFSFDPNEIGVGPGTSVPVNVTVRNSGQEEAASVRVHVVGENYTSTPDGLQWSEACRSETSTTTPDTNGKMEGILGAGEARAITVFCDLPDDASGQLALRTWVERLDITDDFPANDHQRIRGHFDLREYRAASIGSIDSNPRDGPVGGEPRDIPIEIRNEGNVPLEGVQVVLKVFDINDPSRPPVEVPPRQMWTATEPLPVQSGPVSIEDIVDGLSTAPQFTPQDPGLYIAQATIHVPGSDREAPPATVRFQASGDIYDQRFGEAPFRDEDVLNGEAMNQNATIWRIHPSGGIGGSARLVAGDPTTGEIPPGSDGSYVLPAMDLGLLQDATLTFKHKYDLEPGYDAARVEMSTDGGETWEELRPRGQPANGLPEGYPSMALVGANGILQDRVDCFSCAYMGRSQDLPGTTDGWVTAEVDLTRQPSFWADVPIEQFPLDGNAPNADAEPRTTLHGSQFFNETWALDEVDALGNQRYWWIDNQTYSRPAPLTDGLVWWSGSAEGRGPTGKAPPVDTSLQFTIPEDAGWSFDPEDRLVLRFWDWRSGWQDSADGPRSGTGGKFLVDPDAQGLDGLPPVDIIERRADGWTLREIDLTNHIGSPSFGVIFTYISGWADDSVVHTTFDSEALWKNNQGWMIDSVELTRVVGSGDQQPLYTNTGGRLTGTSVSRDQGDVQWTRIEQGDAARQGGWRIDQVVIPDRGETSVWRLQDDGSAEGYPTNVDSRVVTPLVDLRGYRGGTAGLRFDHRYSFIGLQHSPDGHVGLASDAGVVEVQVFDDTTGTFGPWSTLTGPEGLPELGFTGSVRTNHQFLRLEDPVQLPDLAATDHPSIMFSFPSGTFDDPTVQPNDIRLTPGGASPGVSKVGGQEDEGNRFDHVGQLAQGSFTFQFVDRSGDGMFGVGDDAYLIPFSNRLRLTDVVYHDYPGTGQVASYPAGTFVANCDADSDAGCGGGVTFQNADGLVVGPAVRWHDRDGNGVWSHKDTAYLQASAINGITGTDHVDAGDLRLTGWNATRSAPAVVQATDPDVGLPLQPAGRFQVCRANGEHDGGTTTTLYYLTTVPQCTQGEGPLFTQNSYGATFDATAGWITPSRGTLNNVEGRALSLAPMLPYNYTPVYSGDSGGWVEGDMDITHLIGKQVRFAFHAWTGPSEEPCRTRDGYTACNDLHGWSVGNVHIQGQQFQGEPVLIRFRVATDDSMPKGEWSIDDIKIVGQRHQKGILIQSNATHVLDAPGETVSFEGEIRNLGASQTRKLALVIEGEGYTDLDIIEPSDLGSPKDEELPQEYRDGAIVFGPFSLGPGGADGSTRPVQVDVGLPSGDGGEADVRLVILEDVGECTVKKDQTTVCESRYVPVRNGRGAAPASMVWHAEGVKVTQLALVPPLADRSAHLVADPPVVERIGTTAQGEEGPQWPPITFKAAIHNNGTELDGLSAKWTVEQVERKGSDAQRGTRAETRELGPRGTATQAIEPFPRGDTMPIEWEFNLDPEEDGPGLYQATLEISADDFETTKTSLEFLAGGVEPYYRIDFADADSFAQSDWQDTPPQGAEAFGQSPPNIAFRQDGGRFIWGVTETQFALDGLDYCTADADDPCNPSARTSGDPDNNVIYGLHGVASGPLVDLGQVIGDSAVLSLRHGHSFAEHDGAVVEALPVRYPVLNPPQPAFICQDPQTGDPAPMWFQLSPATGYLLGEDRTGYPGVNIQTGPSPDGMRPPPRGWTPHRVNPADIDDGAGPLIGGPSIDQEVTRFSIDRAPVPVCPPGFVPQDGADPPASLVNYTVQLRLRTGTTPGFDMDLCRQFNNNCAGFDENQNPPLRGGSMGWQIDSMGITSVDVQIQPSEGRTLPILDGFQKTFNVQVSNKGPLPETFHIGLVDDETTAINSTWFSFPVPSVELAPGETKTVPFDVFIPAGTFGAGTPVGYIQATSGLDPNIFHRIPVELVLPENPLPDLWAGLDIQTDTEVSEPGKVTRVVTTIHNVGQREADAVPVLIQATLLGDDGQDVSTTTIATKQLPRLAPDEVKAEVSEWTPKQAGVYRIEAIADPDGKLVEGNLANSRADALVEVLPPNLAKVRFTDLTFDGVGQDGYALEGSLVTINATLQNTGDAIANGGRVFLWAGTTQLTEKTIDAIGPGDSASISAVRVASAGETKVRAIYIPTNGQEDSHELTRILRVRGLDLSYEAPTDALAFTPGDTLTTQVNTTNDGNAVEKVVFTLAPGHDGWALAATPNPVTVAPEGGVAWSVLTLQAPDDAVAGEYDLLVLAAPQSQPDVPQHIAVPVHVPSDVHAPVMEVGDATGVPGALTVPVTLTSTSNAAQDLQVITDPVDWLPEPLNVTLGPGIQQAIELVVQVPGTTPPGNQTLKVIVKDLDNNTLVTKETIIHVLSKENGIAAWGSNRTSRIVDITSREFAIDLDFTNTGNVPARPYVVLSSLTDGAGAVPMDVASMDLVSPGASVHLPVAVRVDQEFGGAVTGQADVFMQVASEADNTYKDVLVAQLGIPDLGYLPDLSIKEVKVSPRGVVDASKPVTIEATFENLGRAETPATTLYAYVNGVPADTFDVQTLQAGESVQVNITWIPPASGEYLVHLVADGDDRVVELRDDNNGWTQDLTVEPGSLFQQAKEAPGPAWPFVVLVLLAACLVTRQRRP